MANTADFTFHIRVTRPDYAPELNGEELQSWREAGVSVIAGMLDATAGEYTRRTGGEFEVLDAALYADNATEAA